MRTVMKKGAARVLSLLLCLTMLLGMVPASMAAAEDTGSSGDTQARIVHLDMGRKYFTPDWIMDLIDKMALYGYNQLELDFGNSGAGQLRFKLDNMDVTYNATVTEMMPVQQETLEEPADAEQPTDAIEQPADTTEQPTDATEQPADATEQPTDATEQPADATEQPTDATEQPADATEQPTDEVKALVEEVALQNETVGVTGSDVMEFEARNITVEKTVNLDSAFEEGKYLTETEMADIIAHANQNGIEIVPLLNSPGHFGAVLAGVKDAETGETVDFRYAGSNSSLDITNPDATAFGLAVVEKYAKWFHDRGCTTFNIGADEFANDYGMGFAKLTPSEWTNFDTYITDLYNMLTDIGYDTVRMFNDSVNYGSHTSEIPSGIEVCYWSCGWSGYDLAAARDLADAGYSLINTNSTYYYVLREPNNRNSIPAENDILANFTNESFIANYGTDTVTGAAGSMFCIWCDYPDGTTQEQVMNEISAPLAAMAYQMQGGETGTGLTYELFKEYGINAEVDLGYTSEQNVSVKEGASTEVKVPNVDLSGTYTADDPDVASVSVQYYNQEAGTSYTFAPVGSISRDGQYVIKSKGYYLTLNNGSLGATTNVEEAALWTAGSSGGGYLYSNGYYLRYNDGLTTTTSSRNATSWSFDGSKGLHYAEQVWWWTTNYYITCSNGRWTASTDGSNQVGTRNTESTAARDESVITFNGLSAGETSVIIGDVKYNITVTRELNAEPLTVEYWITNAGVNGSSTDSQSIQIEAEAVYGENGVDLSTLVDQTGMWGEQQVVLWKTTVLDYNNHQSGDSGDDETADGDDFTLIRYWDDSWQYYYNNSWQTINTSGYYGDQVVAYYLQVTDVTTEVTTLTKDWGYSTDSTTPDTSSGQGQVALAFAVVYPDGTLSPATEDLIYDKATIFNYWGGRNFGIISVQNNSDYNVSKITVTDGKRTQNTRRNVWYPDDTITWEKKQLDSGSYWYDEAVAWEKSQGGVPTVYGNGYEWTAKNQATLILIYLEPTQSEDNLTVNYEVEDSGTPFYSFDVKVTNTTGQEEKTFLNSLVNGGHPVNVGSITLDDAAYVVNSSGVQQKFNKDLTTVPALVNTIYGSGLFTYTGASISADGKTLTLTYRKNAASQYQYVVDFGLPVTVPLTELGINPQGVTSVRGTASYGAISGTNQAITYTPNSILKTTATAQLTITFGDGQQQRVAVDFVPASTVYYEAEDFVSTKGAWSEAGTSGSRTQAATKLGAETNNYGYDAAYDNNANGWSNGNADKVTVSAATFNSNSAWPTASFSFTGTGVDIISQTDVKAGAILVDVKDGSNKPVKQYIVNNYYGYTYSQETGWTVSGTNGNGIDSIYQVPVIAVRGLNHGNYNVTITVAYDSLFDVANKGSFDFYLDAIRVYNTLENSSVYATDGEANPIFVPVHERVTGFGTTGTLVDGLLNATLDQFKVVGPNNEVYLAPGQSVTLEFKDADKAGKGQIAARIISGAGPAKLDIGGQTVTVKSTVDMYYELSNNVNSKVKITNVSSATIALTMFKFFDVKQ
ncbi:family 20 glycosylhydrolase [Pseudoflavonifractor phocaeensis]|uniref:family 20 glycosylhydrolase n=1 Tax=Pseudoflavonifractor phocaeensis TaxID=1870988 RepID=UPI00195DD1D3|nr:family 20 glycosylhydrolase [Pseudoflavonifractor phocaeensis]MBM6937984.1 family 20 glycosylhydrolase [Pseudoflavonifractor phocaeensis]